VGVVQVVQHVEEVLDVAQVLLRHIEGSSDTNAIAVGSDSWCSTQQSMNLFIA